MDYKVQNLAKIIAVSDLIVSIYLFIMAIIFGIGTFAIAFLGIVTIVIGIGIIFLLCAGYAGGISIWAVSSAVLYFKSSRAFRAISKEDCELSDIDVNLYKKKWYKEIINMAIGIVVLLSVLKYAFKEVFEGASTDSVTICTVAISIVALGAFILSFFAKRKIFKYMATYVGE